MEILGKMTKQLQAFRDLEDISEATYIKIAERNIVTAIANAMKVKTESPSTNATNGTGEVSRSFRFFSFIKKNIRMHNFWLL